MRESRRKEGKGGDWLTEKEGLASLSTPLFEFGIEALEFCILHFTLCSPGNSYAP